MPNFTYIKKTKTISLVSLPNTNASDSEKSSFNTIEKVIDVYYAKGYKPIVN